MAVRPKRGAPDQWEVYALASAPQPARLRIGRLFLRAFSFGPVAAIVGPPGAADRSSEDALREQHAIVLALAERIDPLLPARFGSRLTRARIDATIRPSIGILAAALEHVRGRQQMTVRLAGPSASDRPSPVSTTGTAYLAERRAAFHAVPAEAGPLKAAVGPLVIDERVQPGRGGIRVTLFHLIARGNADEYRAAVQTALPAMAPWTAAVSGPWPAFAFAPELLG